METFPKTDLNQVRRVPQRGQYDKETIYAIVDDARIPNTKEAKATHIVSIPIEFASAKIREGGPGDDDEDYGLDVWAGVLPMSTVFGELTADDKLKEGVSLPAYLANYAKSRK